MSGTKCLTCPERKETDCDECYPKTQSDEDRSQDTYSSVNLLYREYNREKTDLEVKVPGGTVSVSRKYYNNQWYWEQESDRAIPTRADAQVVYTGLGDDIDIIMVDWPDSYDRVVSKAGVVYELSRKAKGSGLNN